MKKSALKEAIKNEIKSVLSENQMTTDEAFKILRDIHKQIFHDDRMDSDYQLMGQALDHLQAGEVTRMMSDEERESKLQQARRGGGKEEPLRKLAAIGKKEDEKNIREDEEPTSAELKKKDSVATISNKLQKLTAKMKKKAKEFKEAEGKAKDKLKDELKDMTAEKKELEKSL